MRGYPPGRCPRIREERGGLLGGSTICGWSGYKIIAQGVFILGSGYDPLGIKVKCRYWGHEYYLFPLKDIAELEKEEENEIPSMP